LAGQIEWLSPTAGDTISATVELKGTVNVPNLGFYKYEFSLPGADSWTTIAAGNSPLVNGTIGYWNTAQLPAGDYLLRLVVVDNQNGFFPACIVSVRVASP
jgi:FtsP/CotA-like multicopper oxidase with cupredoxin domain